MSTSRSSPRGSSTTPAGLTSSTTRASDRTRAPSASKTAALALARAVRIELRSHGTLVVAVYAGFVDTDMAKGVDVPKVSPQSIVTAVLAGIECGTEEVLAPPR